MRFLSLATCVFVLCGAATGWLVAALVPAGLRQEPLHREDFRLTRKADQPLEITDGRWTFVPLRFPDFDLQMVVELGEGVDLDVLVRQVEPRMVGNELLPFAGRFSVLRLSSDGDGPGWRTRDEAVLGPRGGGVGVAPGYASSVWIEGRGRQLTANVAGKKQATFVADDEYGMFAFAVRGGKAAVHDLVIRNLGQARRWLWSPWLWTGLGAVAAAALACFAHRRRLRAPWFVLGGLPMPLLAWLVHSRADLDLAWPAPTSLALVLGGCLLLPLAQLGGRLLLVLGVFASALLLASGDRLLRHDTRAIDAVFGPDAGAQISEAHAQMVRGPGGLHAVDRPGKCVFLLGGQLLYDRGLPGEHLELLLGSALRSALRQPVEVPCLPTVDGHVAQQWRLFTTCFPRFRPAVVVLGIPRDEMAIDATGERRSSPARVHDTLAAARTWCATNGSRLVLFADHSLPAELLAVVRAAATDGVLLVEARDGAGPADLARQLSAAIVPLLTP